MSSSEHYRRTRTPGIVDSSVQPPSPDDISSLIRWYKAYAITGLSDGDYVETWVDSAGINNGTSAGGARPTYKVSIVNGLPVVRFAGAHYVDCGTFDLTTGTYYVVWSRTSATNNDAVLMQTGTYYSYLQYSSTWYTANSISATVAMPASTFVVKSCVYTGTQHLRYTNGSAETPQNSTAGIKFRYIGASGFAIYGDIAEVIVFNEALSDINRGKMDYYLKYKYGL